MKCCPQCEQLNESSQIYCEICSTRLVNQLKPRRRIHLSSEMTVANLKRKDKGLLLMPLLALIVTTILVGLGGVYQSNSGGNQPESTKDSSAVVQELKGLQLTGSQKKIK